MNDYCKSNDLPSGDNETTDFGQRKVLLFLHATSSAQSLKASFLGVGLLERPDLMSGTFIPAYNLRTFHAQES